MCDWGQAKVGVSQKAWGLDRVHLCNDSLTKERV